MADQPISLYLHVPFCSLKCSYCDFNSYAKLEQQIPPFVDALVRELQIWSPIVRGLRVETVFFGGGTPSLLPLDDVRRIVAQVFDSFDVTDEAEITMEANPGTVGPAYLGGMLGAGVNRVSFGVQSFHDDELKTLERIHTAGEVKQCFRWARDAGFRRINLDLIYGLPEQTLDRWQASVEDAVTLRPEHVSAYALTVEEGTKLAYDIDHGRAPGPDPDLQADMYEWTQKRLAEAGYAQYEISNWSLPGEECRHNLAYWRNQEWLGLGPGAHSHWGGYRFADVYSPRQYVALIGETEAPMSVTPEEVLRSMRQVTFVDSQSLELQMADTAILGLRLNEGLDLHAFEKRFGLRADDVYAPVVTEMTGAGMLESENGRLKLTDRGRYVANEVFLRLLPD